MSQLRHSKQREAIYDFLCTRKDHPTAEFVYENLRPGMPNISLGTVYRNLTLLTSLGRIRRLTCGDGMDHFDADMSPHQHLLCSVCGAVEDIFFDDSEIEHLAQEHFGGVVKGHDTVFHGFCSTCAASCNN